MITHGQTVAVTPAARKPARPTKADARQRAALWLRGRFGANATKDIQALFNLEERTAQRVMKGDIAWPVLHQMGESFGKDFVLHVHGFDEQAEFWATETGVRHAPEGHARYVREAIRLHDSVGGDLLRHGLANLGWIAITLSESGAELRHSDVIEPRAVSFARDWLADHQPRRVSINGAIYLDHLSAMAKLEDRAEAREAMLSASWQVDRLALDAVKADPLRQFLKLCHETRDDPNGLPRVLAQGGLMPCSALMLVKGDSVLTCWLGHKQGVNPAQVIGRDLRDRPGDRRYPEMIGAHVRLMLDQPDGTYHELRGVEIDGKTHDYNRAGFAGPANEAGERLVATVSERLLAA